MTTHELLQRAQKIYDERLKTDLERDHMDFFVAIEPESGDYFLDRTFSQAAAKARAAHPGRRAAVFRVGHDAAIHMGAGIR